MKTANLHLTGPSYNFPSDLGIQDRLGPKYIFTNTQKHYYVSYRVQKTAFYMIPLRYKSNLYQKIYFQM